jgi:hypothetical protein
VTVHLQNGKVSLEELQQILKEASKEYSHFEEHAKFLEAKNTRCVCVWSQATGRQIMWSCHAACTYGSVLAWQLQKFGSVTLCRVSGLTRGFCDWSCCGFAVGMGAWIVHATV